MLFESHDFCRGVSAYRVAFGSRPADFLGRQDNDEDMSFTQDTSLSAQFAQQRGLRMRGLEAAHKEVAGSKVRHLLANKQSFDREDLAVGDSVLSYEAQSRNSSPRWTGSCEYPGY